MSRFYHTSLMPELFFHMTLVGLFVCVICAGGAGRRLGPGVLRPAPGAPSRAPPVLSVSLPGVSFSCSSSELTVRVERRLFAASDAAPLTLGRSCRSNGAARPSGDALFRYPITACGVRRQLGPTHVLYRFVLRHSSRRAGVRRQRLQCRLKRYHHVQQLAVRPTWRPATSKVLRNQLGGYQIHQMNADWTARRDTSTYFLGQKVNLQVSTHFLPAGRKLYIDYCYATTSDVPWSTPRHMVVENFGCMVESTGFFETRSWGSINFSFRAFLLTPGPSAQIFLHCRLFVMAGGPSATAKSCSYNKEEGYVKLSSGFHSSGLFVFNKKSRSLATIPASNTSSHHTTLDVIDNSDTSADEDLVWQNDYEGKEREKVETLLPNKELNPAEVCGERQEPNFLKGVTPPSEKVEECVDESCYPGLMGEPTLPIPSSGLFDKLEPSSVRGGVEDDYNNYGLVSGVGEVMVFSDY